MSVVYLRLSRNPTPLDSPRQPSDVQQHRPWPLQLQRQESHFPVLLQNLQKDQAQEKSSTNEETQTSQNGGLTCTIWASPVTPRYRRLWFSLEMNLDHRTSRKRMQLQQNMEIMCADCFNSFLKESTERFDKCASKCWQTTLKCSKRQAPTAHDLGKSSWYTCSHQDRTVLESENPRVKCKCAQTDNSCRILPRCLTHS